MFFNISFLIPLSKNEGGNLYLLRLFWMHIFVVSKWYVRRDRGLEKAEIDMDNLSLLSPHLQEWRERKFPWLYSNLGFLADQMETMVRISSWLSSIFSHSIFYFLSPSSPSSSTPFRALKCCEQGSRLEQFFKPTCWATWKKQLNYFGHFFYIYKRDGR